MARCDPSRADELFGPLRVYINWGDYMGDGIVRTTLRFPPEPAVEEFWMPSADNTAGFAGFPDRLMQSLLVASEVEGGTFVSRATPYRDDPITAVWDLADAAPAFAEVAETCEP